MLPRSVVGAKVLATKYDTHKGFLSTHGPQISKSVPLGDLVGDSGSVAVLELDQERVGEHLFGPGHLTAAGHRDQDDQRYQP